MALRLAVLCLALVTSGCIPHVLHGPRVEDGITGQLSLTLGRNTEWGEGGEFRVLPSLYGGVRSAHVPEDGTGVAYSIGLQVPALLLPFFVEEDGLDALLATSYVDVYIQPNRRATPGADGGIGVLFSTQLAAPYVQFGRLNEGGDGWYTTQLVAFARGGDLTDLVYLPTIAYRDRDDERNRTANWSLGAGIGRDAERTEWIVIIGGTFEFGRRPRAP